MYSSLSSRYHSAPYTSFFFFFNDTATTEIYTLSLHDALPISHRHGALVRANLGAPHRKSKYRRQAESCEPVLDRKSTRLNSSHSQISYAVFCLKKKKKTRPSVYNHEVSHHCPPHDGSHL